MSSKLGEVADPQTTAAYRRILTSANLERYCVDSGRAVSMVPGDRCIRHGVADSPCTTKVRTAQCEHPYLSPNHTRPHCSECGRDVITSSATLVVAAFQSAIWPRSPVRNAQNHPGAAELLNTGRDTGDCRS
jgi:hypothetical protein